MRTAIITFLFASFSLNGYSQTRTTTNSLIGTWELADTSSGKMTFCFVDSARMTMKTQQSPLPEMAFEGSYHIQTIDDSTSLITMSLESMGLKQKSDWLARLVDANILKLQIAGTTVPYKWSEQTNNTGTYIRRKP